MTIGSYERQHLALWAAGRISGGANGSQTTFGCTMTRIGVGQYGLTLDADHGLGNDQTFTKAQPKGTASIVAVVADVSNIFKTIDVITYDGDACAANAEIEVGVFRSVLAGR